MNARQIIEAIRYPTERQKAILAKRGIKLPGDLKKALKLSERTNDKYLDWVAREYLKLQEFTYLVSWADWFDRNKDKLRQAGKSLDIYDYDGRSIGMEMQAFVSTKEKPVTKKKRDYTVLANYGEWRACVPWSHGAAVYLGNQFGKVKVRWCVSANSHEGQDMFGRYTRDGILVFMIHPKAKFAAHFHLRDDEAGTYNLFDAQDHSLVTRPASLPGVILEEAVRFATREAKRRGVPVGDWALVRTDVAHQHGDPADDDFDADAVNTPDPDERHLPAGQTVNFDDIEDERLFSESVSARQLIEAEDPKSVLRAAKEYDWGDEANFDRGKGFYLEVKETKAFGRAHDLGEGPFDTLADAKQFFNSEVGVPCRVVYVNDAGNRYLKTHWMWP